MAGKRETPERCALAYFCKINYCPDIREVGAIFTSLQSRNKAMEIDDSILFDFIFSLYKTFLNEKNLQSWQGKISLYENSSKCGNIHI